MDHSLGFDIYEDYDIQFFDEAYLDTREFLEKTGEWEDCDFDEMIYILLIMLYIKSLNKFINTNLADTLANIVLRPAE